ncbi:MAG: prohibitin family protein [Planctomycetota bacterium]|jgi:regulator of protease activity HflC (stomatin/prohibitin superfamily)|nr:prohibitin family protein [Planctomycetota bacterium]
MMMAEKWMVGGVSGIFLVAVIIGGSFYSVNQGERAVLLRFGKVVSDEGAGLHFKMPLIETAKFISTRTEVLTANIESYSKDAQAMSMAISINYRVDAAAVKEIYSQFGMGYKETLILPKLQSLPKDSVGKMSAMEIVQGRDKLNGGIIADLRKYFEPNGVYIDSLNLENINFSDAFEKSVEQRMQAEVEVQKVQQNLARERVQAEMLIVQQKAEAEKIIINAKANADAVVMQGEAEAKAIRLKAEALAQNSNLVNLLTVEKWNGVLPVTTLGNSVPLLNLGGK